MTEWNYPPYTGLKRREKMITDISGEGLSGKISSYIRKSLGRQVSDKEINGVDYDEYELTKRR